METDKFIKENKKTGMLVILAFGIVIVAIISAFIYPNLVIPLTVVAVILFIVALNRSKETSQEKTNLAERTIKQLHSNMPNYNPTQVTYLENYTSLLSIDENNKKICIINNNKPEVLNFSDVLQSELIEDGVSVTKVSRRSQISGALVGGILAGGVGAIIGGLTSSTKTNQEVSKIRLQLMVNNTSNPIREFYFLNKQVPIKKDKQEYKDAFEQANLWYKATQVIIGQIN